MYSTCMYNVHVYTHVHVHVHVHFFLSTSRITSCVYYQLQYVYRYVHQWYNFNNLNLKEWHYALVHTVICRIVILPYDTCTCCITMFYNSTCVLYIVPNHP